MTTKKTRNAVLRARMREKNILIAPGAHDALCATIFEQAGFEAVYMSGFANSAGMIGRPDVGLMTYSEMLGRATALADRVEIPIIADGDTGYGNAVNVYRTVRGYEKAGISCIQIEDQVAPKKCGHMVGREVIAAEEMVGKIHAACDARRDDDFMIMVRTDARTTHGIDAALERASLYQEAGADILFVESPESLDEMRRITAHCTVPTVANMVEFGRTPLYTAEELQELGYRLMLMPVAATFLIAKAISEAARVMRTEGSSKSLMGSMLSMKECTDLLGLKDVREMEARYATGRVLRDGV
ncbi:MAG TPA: carboxyvinyl-carboxyphosphonate phosphorylmutase [Synergistaceae bacterium]|nr:carboxyvinyl-carboxyphosphonate phosphorylmutase [Synergistaceae bacterium]